MAFATERDLESHLRQLIATRITANHPNIYTLNNKKAVDIVICRDGDRAAAFFIEVKLYKPAHGRLGIGTGTGGGYQPEIIVCNPDYFEAHLRWVIVDGGKAAPWYLFIPTSILKLHLAGGKVGDKQNNINVSSLFNNVPALDESSLVVEMEKWLMQ